MSYCTITDIENDVSKDTLVALTNDNENAVSINSAIVTDRIDTISTLIDGYLRDRYSLPIENANDLKILKSICISLVVCELYQRRFGTDYPESLADRKRGAVKELEKMQSGRIKLESGMGVTSPGIRKVSQRTKYFDEDSLGAYL